MIRTPHAVMVALLALVAAAGCRRGARVEAAPPIALSGIGTEDLTVERRPVPEGWPSVMVVTPGAGPALYLGPGGRDPAVGYLEPGLRVQLQGAPVRNRAEVLVAGTLPATGWIPTNRLGAHVRRRGRVEGTPAFLATNDIVALTGVEGGQYRLAVHVPLRDGVVLGPYAGTLPRDQVAAEPFDGPAQPLTPGECYRLPPGVEVPLYEGAGGEQAAILPPLDPPLEVTVLRRDAVWFGIRAGQGPYVSGYVRGALTPCTRTPPAERPTDGTPKWMRRERGPLFRVAQGTRLTFNGRTIARLREGGWARVLGQPQLPMVDVFVSVDDDAALRGLVPRGALVPTGTIDESAIRAQLRGLRTRLDGCYRPLLAAQPELTGAVHARFTVTTEGAAHDIEITDNETGAESLATCVVEALRDTTFSPAARGGPIRVAYPFWFEPTAEVETPPEPVEDEDLPDELAD